jgi:hypothetical protein
MSNLETYETYFHLNSLTVVELRQMADLIDLDLPRSALKPAIIGALQQIDVQDQNALMYHFRSNVESPSDLSSSSVRSNSPNFPEERNPRQTPPHDTAHEVQNVTTETDQQRNNIPARQNVNPIKSNPPRNNQKAQQPIPVRSPEQLREISRMQRPVHRTFDRDMDNHSDLLFENNQARKRTDNRALFNNLPDNDFERYEELSLFTNKDIEIYARFVNASKFPHLPPAKSSTLVKILRWELEDHSILKDLALADGHNSFNGGDFKDILSFSSAMDTLTDYVEIIWPSKSRLLNSYAKDLKQFVGTFTDHEHFKDFLDLDKQIRTINRSFNRRDYPFTSHYDLLGNFHRKIINITMNKKRFRTDQHYDHRKRISDSSQICLAWNVNNCKQKSNCNREHKCCECNSRDHTFMDRCNTDNLSNNQVFKKYLSKH